MFSRDEFPEGFFFILSFCWSVLIFFTGMRQGLNRPISSWQILISADWTSWKVNGLGDWCLGSSPQGYSGRVRTLDNDWWQVPWLIQNKKRKILKWSTWRSHCTLAFHLAANFYSINRSRLILTCIFASIVSVLTIHVLLALEWGSFQCTVRLVTSHTFMTERPAVTTRYRYRL